MEICALRQSLLDCNGHALVIGGPGSGKTTIALKKAVVRIRAGMTLGQSVLFLSFSRAAVARVGEATRQEVPKDQRGMLSMQTFHSFFGHCSQLMPTSLVAQNRFAYCCRLTSRLFTARSRRRIEMRGILIG
ncbi:UvrD-helicase domain-containing protein [Rhodoferax sp. PAMC 29310]|uniref:UvrD-helicase domain-containing protein n=1 Tax=Rhodoferax sp. PAMC 29310 TaxID=2822760 RepID=UPI001F0A900B|nr:UvrD-helicase domain-containing protein [Rhodoferax sp. PAMC 29310]